MDNTNSFSENYEMNKAGGLTLIEMMVVVAIATILLTLVVPGFRSVLAGRATDAAVSALTGDFRFARSEAIKRGRPVSVCRSSDGRSCDAGDGDWSRGWIVFTDTADDQVVGGQDQVLRVQAPPPFMASIIQTSPSNAVYTFRMTGLARGAAGNMVVTPSASTPKGTRLICISMQGRLSVRAPGTRDCS
jgi:type IV fimbrial biogenesis protein FimT